MSWGGFMKPYELFLEYVKDNYKAELNAVEQCKHQSRINVDYTLLDNYFEENAGKHFFQYPNTDLTPQALNKE